jgi:hypothetical protein
MPACNPLHRLLPAYRKVRSGSDLAPSPVSIRMAGIGRKPDVRGSRCEPPGRWKCVIPDLPGLGCLGFKIGHPPRPPIPRLSRECRWQSEGQRDIPVHGEFAALCAPRRVGHGNHVAHSRFGRCPNARRSRGMNTTLEDKAGDPWQIIVDLQRKLDARTAELQAQYFGTPRHRRVRRHEGGCFFM